MEHSKLLFTCAAVMGLGIILINSEWWPLSLRNSRSNYHVKRFSICPQFVGRLGNKMFIFASSYGIALEKRMKMEIQKDSELLRIFQLTVIFSTKKSDCSSGNIKIIQEQKGSSFDTRLTDFQPNSHVSLRTYLQSYLYFEKYRNEVRRQFTFQNHIQSKAEDILQKLLQKYNMIGKNYTLIGIHVRRGDRARLSITDKNAGFKMATKEYIQKAVDWYTARYTNILYIAASNGMDWTKENMPKNIRVEYLQNNTAAVDLAILSLSDHFISTLGSFSWWAGWLAGGNVTYYKWPAAEDGRYRKSFSDNFMDHYYPDWVGL